jgi:hypothetical protein
MGYQLRILGSPLVSLGTGSLTRGTLILYLFLGDWDQFVWWPSETAWFVFGAQVLKESPWGTLAVNNSEKALCANEQCLSWTGPFPSPTKCRLWPGNLMVLWCWHRAHGDPSPRGDHLGIQTQGTTLASSFLPWLLAVCPQVPVSGIYSRLCT